MVNLSTCQWALSQLASKCSVESSTARARCAIDQGQTRARLGGATTGTCTHVHRYQHAHSCSYSRLCSPRRRTATQRALYSTVAVQLCSHGAQHASGSCAAPRRAANCLRRYPVLLSLTHRQATRVSNRGRVLRLNRPEPYEPLVVSSRACTQRACAVVAPTIDAYQRPVCGDCRSGGHGVDTAWQQSAGKKFDVRMSPAASSARKIHAFPKSAHPRERQPHATRACAARVSVTRCHASDPVHRTLATWACARLPSVAPGPASGPR